MAAKRSSPSPFRRCGRRLRPAGSPVDRLDPTGPLQPDTDSGRWPLRNGFDAIDALDLSRPVDLNAGVLVLFLDHRREPIVTLAVRHAPADQLEPIVSLVIEAAEGMTFEAIVLGIVGDTTREHSLGPGASVGNGELRHWADMARTLDCYGIELLDVVTLQGTCWSSVALTAGDLPYLAAADPRPRWYEDSGGSPKTINVSEPPEVPPVLAVD